MAAPFRHQRPIVVEWGDCDPAGIVFYPRYFAMFDAGSWALLTVALGVGGPAMLDRYGIIGFPMVDTRAAFHVPLRQGDRAILTSHVEAIGRSSFEVTHQLHRDDGTLAVAGWEKRVWAAAHPDIPGRIVGVTVPGDVRAALLDAPSGETP